MVFGYEVGGLFGYVGMGSGDCSGFRVCCELCVTGIPMCSVYDALCFVRSDPCTGWMLLCVVVGVCGVVVRLYVEW